MKNKYIIMIFLILILVGCKEKNSIDKFELKVKKTLDFENIRVKEYLGDNRFICTDDSNHIFIKNSITNEIEFKNGGKGKGPGNYIRINTLKVIDNLIFIVDSISKRISILDKSLKLKYTLLANIPYVSDVVNKGNKVYVFGLMLSQSNENKPVAHIYDIMEERVLRNEMKISIDYKAFPYFKRNGNEMQTSKALIIKDKIIIVNSMLNKIIEYDMLSKEYTYYPIDFEGFIDPSKLNLKKCLKDETFRELGFKGVGLELFVYVPRAIWYNPIIENYMVFYFVPYKKQKESNYANQFKLVLFDESFQCTGYLDTNRNLLDFYQENGRHFFLSENLQYNLLNPDIEYNNNDKYEILELEKL